MGIWRACGLVGAVSLLVPMVVAAPLEAVDSSLVGVTDLVAVGDNDDQGDDNDDQGEPRPVADVVLPGAVSRRVKLGDEPSQLGDEPIWVAPVDASGVGRRLEVSSVGGEVADALGLIAVGLVIEPVDRDGPVDVRVTVGYQGFEGMFGGDFASRLSGGVVSGCVVADTAGESACVEVAVDVGGVVNLEDRTVSFVFTAGDVGGGFVGEGLVRRAGGSRAAGLISGLRGSAGDFSQTSLLPSAEWSQGGSSGNFSWSYGFGLPDVGVGGPAPGFSASYSSQSVDGMNSNTNSQPGQIGLGWGLGGEAFVERSYASCAQLYGGVNDWCWNGQNASLVLNGVSSPLVPIDGTHTQWRLERDNGWRITRHAGVDVGLGGATVDNDGEWWEVITQDGTSYKFGSAGGSSTWAAPVIGGKSGDPCRGVQPGNWCYQAWRWNLDVVVDPVGTQMQLRYEAEINHYGARGDSWEPKPYVRGGMVSEVRWGIPASSPSWDSATHRIEFATVLRCNDKANGAFAGTSCPAPSKTTGNRYPDTPVDLECGPAPRCKHYEPSFYTTRRLARVQTSTQTDGGWQLVDRWHLLHEFPGSTPNPIRLWLREIRRVDVGGVTSLPGIRFGAIDTLFANRYDDNLSKGWSDIKLFRVGQIRDELGGEIVVEYGQPDGCVGRPAGGWDSNASNCYPQWWKPKGASAGFAEFNKYVVTKITRGAMGPGAAYLQPGVGYVGEPVVTTYTYHGGAAWRHDERPGVSFNDQSWSQWRGYQHVTATTGGGPDRSVVDTTYLRGMNGDRVSGGGSSVVSVSSQFGPDSNAPVTVTDEDWFQGRVLESRLSDAGGREISATITVPAVIKSVVGADPGDHYQNLGFQGGLVSRMVVVRQAWSRSAAGSNKFAHVTRVDTAYDNTYMLPVAVHEWGDTLGGGIDNDRCTTTAYATDTGLAVDRPATVELHNGLCAAATVSRSDYGYDSNARLVSESVANQGGALTSVVAYGSDPFGRPTSLSDPKGFSTSVEYSSNAGVLSTVKVTNAAGHSASTVRNIRGNVVSSSDPHGHVSTGVYDGLGRLTSSRSPTETGADDTVTYSYELPTSNLPDSYTHSLNKVTTSTLINAGGGRVETVAYVDGLGRTLETQSPSPVGGRIVSASVLNDRGLAVRTIDAFHTSGAPGSGALSLGVIGTQEHETHTVFDAAGRPVRSEEHVNGVVVNVVTSSYEALVTTVTPQLSAPSSVSVDAFGRTIATFDGAGEYVSSYDVRGLPTVSGPSNAQLSFGYDMAGRQTSVFNPNGGNTVFDYDANSNIIKRTDAEDAVIVTGFDILNRPTTRTANGVLTAEWSYDTLGVGLPVSTTSYQPGGEYVSTNVDYDARDRSLGVRYTGPGGIDYTEAVTGFTPADQPTGVNFDGFASMPGEQIGFDYDALANPTAMGGNGAVYVSSIGYDALGRITSRVLGNSEVTRTVTYSPRRLLESLQATVGGVTVQNDVYSYNAEANITAIDHSTGGHRECFDLDAQARLTRAYTVGSGAGCGGTANVDVAPSGAGYDQEWDLSPFGDITRRSDITVDGTEQFDYLYGPGPNQVGQYGTAGIDYNRNGARTGTTTVPQSVSIFEPVVQERLLNTRDNDGSVQAAGTNRVVDVTGAAGVTAQTTAVMINVVSVDPVGPASLSVWPADGVRNTAEVVINQGFHAVAQLTVVAVDAGRFRVGANSNDTHVVIDLVGVYNEIDIATNQTGVSEGRVLPVAPYRAYDSRDQSEVIMGAGERRQISVADPLLPDDVKAVIFTLTATEVPALGFFTVLETATDPGGVPGTASLNAEPGTSRANQVAVMVPIGAAREFTLFSLSGGHVIIDVTAYVTGPTSAAGVDGLYTQLRSPTTLATFDTTAEDTDTIVQVAGQRGIPADAIGVTAIIKLDAQAPGFVTAYPADQPWPQTSNVNAVTDETLIGYATTKLSASGAIKLRVRDAARVTYTATGFYTGSLPDSNIEPTVIEPAVLKWDAQQHLAETITSTDESTTYDYWPDGARVAQHHPDGTSTLYLGGLDATRDTTGTWTTIRRMYNHAGAAVASRTTDGTINELSWLLGNHQGSITTTITDGVASTRHYQPYGARRGPDPTTEPTTTGFLNQHEDTTSGLTYLNNRYHDPTLGGFISVDPLVVSTGEAYIYAGANPIAYSDPLGLCKWYMLCTDELASALWGMSRGVWDSTYGTFEDGYDLVEYVVTHNPKDTAGKGGEILQGFYQLAKDCNFDERCIQNQMFVQPFLESAEENGWAYAIGELVPEAVGAWLSGGSTTTSSTARHAGRVRRVADRIEDTIDAVTPCPNSFSADTLVLMADGSTKPIEDVVIGDLVWASDPETGEAGPRRVTDVIVGDGVKQLVEVTVDGAAVTATAQHPFWIDDEGRWVDASDLEPGDDLVRPDRSVVDVSAVREWSAVRRVHNLTVEGIHTYYVIVGDDPVLVHNCPMTSNQRALKELVDEASVGGRRPLSVADANTVLDWADEVGYLGWRASVNDVAAPSNWTANPTPHIHIPGAGRSGHVPVQRGLGPR